MRVLYLILIGSMLSISAQAKDIYYGSGFELVKISKKTTFRFNKQVRTISQAERFEINPADSNDPDYSVLTIRPRFSKGTSKVVFILSDGTTVNLRLKITPYNKSGEPFYDLKPKSMLIEREQKNVPEMSAMDFLRSIIQDHEIIGYKRKVTNKWVSTGKIQGVRARLLRTYSGKKYQGFVIELKNRYKTKKYSIHLNELEFKGSDLAIISSVDDEILFPRKKGKHKTLLAVVAKSSASLKDLKLPIKLVNDKKVGK